MDICVSVASTTGKSLSESKSVRACCVYILEKTFLSNPRQVRHALKWRGYKKSRISQLVALTRPTSTGSGSRAAADTDVDEENTQARMHVTYIVLGRLSFVD